MSRMIPSFEPDWEAELWEELDAKLGRESADVLAEILAARKLDIVLASVPASLPAPREKTET